MANELTFKQAMDSVNVRQLINTRLGSKEQATRFIADLSSVVANNYQLQNCDPMTIVSGGFVAQSLQLPLSPTLGFAYLVPYGCKDGNKAQFQIGAKGLVQLALRTGAYERIGYKEVREGEYLGLDEFGEPNIKFNGDENKPIIGYYAYFKFNEQHGGLIKKIYWTNEKLKEHAKKYSKSYGNGKGTDCWTHLFDAMAKKTVIKQLLGKFGIMSVELQTALKYDQAVADENGAANYVDNPNYTPKIEVKSQKDIPVTIDLDKVA